LSRRSSLAVLVVGLALAIKTFVFFQLRDHLLLQPTRP
jgi:hypothetical protein